MFAGTTGAKGGDDGAVRWRGWWAGCNTGTGKLAQESVIDEAEIIPSLGRGRSEPFPAGSINRRGRAREESSHEMALAMGLFLIW